MMRIKIFPTVILGAALLSGSAAWAQTDKVEYVPRYKDPVIEQMKDQADSLDRIRDSITRGIRETQDSLAKKADDERKQMRFSFEDVVKPASPDVFETPFHFPPVAQYLTGTCWCFSGTSFLESEVYRRTGQKIKLSEMYTVYYEYVEKARYFVQRRGDFHLGQGSETNAVTRIIGLYGAVPLDVYPGYIDDERYNHSQLSREIRAYLGYVNDNDLWDEAAVVAHVKLILNKYLGQPPETFMYEGRLMTPRLFADEVLKINPDDYLSVMSTLSIPFYTMGEYEVPDNWWHDSSYYNLPLDEWYAVIVKAIDNGYTVDIGGDNSEPGWNGFEDAAIIPDFDIPQDYINQESREYRFHYHASTDDHGLHLVGHTVIDGRDWFLIKDSGRSGRWGQFPGYYFMRDDYIRLKMLTITVHRDMLKDVLDKFAPTSEE
jgi:bleomycin hydrolase